MEIYDFNCEISSWLLLQFFTSFLFSHENADGFLLLQADVRELLNVRVRNGL